MVIPTLPTRLDPLIRAVVRKAENIYSKVALHREDEMVAGRRKRSGDEVEGSSPLWEDSTDVSVVALRGFLEDLLGVEHAGHMPPAAHHPQDGQTTDKITAYRATEAYRSTGIVVHDENIESADDTIKLPPASPDSAVTLSDDFGEEGRTSIQGYIVDLGILEQKGITHLTLQRHLTFIDSIRQAIEQVKKAL